MDCQDQEIRVRLTGERGCTIRFVNCILSSVNDGDMEIQGQDTIVTVSDLTKDGVELICVK